MCIAASSTVARSVDPIFVASCAIVFKSKRSRSKGSSAAVSCRLENQLWKNQTRSVDYRLQVPSAGMQESQLHYDDVCYGSGGNDST